MKRITIYSIIVTIIILININIIEASESDIVASSYSVIHSDVGSGTWRGYTGMSIQAPTTFNLSIFAYNMKQDAICPGVNNITLSVWNAGAGGDDFKPSTLIGYCTGTLNGTLISTAAYNWYNFTGCTFLLTKGYNYSFLVVNGSGDGDNQVEFQGNGFAGTYSYGHPHYGTDGSTWNEVAGSYAFIAYNTTIIPPPALTISISNPTNNAHISKGFSINGTCIGTEGGVPGIVTINDTNWGSNTGNATNFNFNYVGSIDDGKYNVKLNCSDAGNTINNIVEWSFYKDTNTPPITDNNSISGTRTYINLLILNFTIGPDFLYRTATNVTCQNGSNIFSELRSFNGQNQTAVINNQTNLSKCGNGVIINITIQAADTHTAKYIDFVPHSTSNKEIRFNPYSNDEIKIYPLNKDDYYSIITEKEFDRHTFKFKKTNAYKNKESKNDVFIIEGENVEQILQGKYVDKGHFVAWHGFDGQSYWIDFNNDEEYPVNVIKLDNNKFEIDIDCSKDNCDNDYTFKSLGGLNENVATALLYYDGSDVIANETFELIISENVNTTLQLNLSFNTLKYLASSNVILMWNVTNYTATNTFNTNASSSINLSYYSVTVFVPSALGINGTTVPHKWYYTVTYANTSMSFRQTLAKNQSIYEYIFDNCSLGTQPTINFFMVNETGQPNNWINSSFEMAIYLSSPIVTKNGSFKYSGNDHYHFCIFPSNTSFAADIYVKYSSAGFDQRNWIKHSYLLNNNTQNISLYLLETSKSTEISTYVKDQYDLPLANYLIEAWKYLLGENKYILVSIGSTDGDGKVLFDLDTLSEHKFQVFTTNSSTNIYDSGKMNLYNIEYFFRIVGEGITAISQELLQVINAVSWSGLTAIMTWHDGGNLISQACLHTFKAMSNGTVLLNANCSSADLGTLSYAINNVSGSYIARVYVVASADGQGYYLESAGFENQQRTVLTSSETLIGSLLYIGTLFMIGISINPFVGFVILILGVIVMYKLGFILVSLVGIIGFIVGIIFKMKIIKRDYT